MPLCLTVKQLNLYVRSLIEGDSKLAFINVSGEISNFKNHYASGHIYFSLKDSDAVIKCVMFKSNAQKLKADISDGMAVVCTGRVSVYEKDGQYQMYVENIVPSGEGDLYLKFSEIKTKLERKGLFDSTHKKAIPKFPKSIAVITSESGAALQDILNIICRRYPLCEIVLCPATVQGYDAPASIIDALKRVYKLNNIDLIILGRGGGSAEDLWAFNDENLAETVYSSPIPIISAVGHETDFTICDFVADMRAPTPSAAAELAVPDIGELMLNINDKKLRIKNITEMYLNIAYTRLNNIIEKSCLKYPDEFIDENLRYLDTLKDKLFDLFKEKIISAEKSFSVDLAKLESLSPLKVLLRGYAIVSDNGNTVTDVSKLCVGENINLRFSNGSAECKVVNIKE